MKNKYFNYLAFIVVIIWILYNLYQGDIYDKEIKNNGITTVGKVTKFKASSGSPYLRYQFYVNSRSYGSESRRDKKGEKIGEFYKVIYSSKNPEVKRIYLDEKIPPLPRESFAWL